MKYYLRGFGIGVLFVTILFALLREDNILTDDEIQKRAADLGMRTEQEVKEKELAAVRETELTWQEKLKEQEKEYEALLLQKEAQQGMLQQDAIQQEAPQESTDIADGESQTEQEPESTESVDTEFEEPEVTELDDSVEADSESDSEKEEPEYVQVTINRGMTSEQVSALMRDAGLISNAMDFNRYLVSSGKQSSIRVGVYNIPQDADYATIMTMITSRP